MADAPDLSRLSGRGAQQRSLWQKGSATWMAMRRRGVKAKALSRAAKKSDSFHLVKQKTMLLSTRGIG